MLTTFSQWARRAAAAFVAVTASAALAACGGDELALPQLNNSTKGGTLDIVAATELQELEPLIDAASQDLGFDITMTAPGGTLANSQALKRGEFDGQYDATWFATNRYADIIGASGKLGSGESIAHSPVVLGVQEAKAEELGWLNKQPTWQEISDAGLSFGMTDPTTSNSGFSALAAVATAFADTGRAFSADDIPTAAPKIAEFFSHQSMTSGSSGWLADRFLDRRGSADAIINYESVLLGDRFAAGGVVPIIPVDGVISADYPLTPLQTPKNADAAEKVRELTEWFKEHSDDVARYHLRTDNSLDVSGVDTQAQLYELPYPGNQTAVALLQEAYSNDLRKPGTTAFVLDTSGSMEGQRMELLKSTMRSLVDGTAASSTGSVAFRNREHIEIVPFDREVEPSTGATVDSANPDAISPLLERVEQLTPGGFTNIYDALQTAYAGIETGDGTIGSIVLMTDGERTSGPDFNQFRVFYNDLTGDKRAIPTFVILYGEANVAEMQSLAELTGGKTFDALGGDLAQAFEEIRAYQ